MEPCARVSAELCFQGKMVENEAGIGSPFGFEFSFHRNPVDTITEFRMHSVVAGKLFAASETHCTEQRTTTKASR